MSLLLKEYVSFVPVQDKSAPIRLKEADNNLTEPVPGTLMVDMEGIHAYPFSTRNYTRYMEQALKGSVPKWTNPYMRPVIMYHNDQDGKIIGRIYNVEYTNTTSVEGVGGLIFTTAIPDTEAAKKVQDRRLETVSIGVSANDVRCSICGKQITNAEEGCPEGHTRGAEYDGEICYWDIYDIDPKEISYVIVPSDPYARNIRTYHIGEQGIKLAAADEGIKALNLKEGNQGADSKDMDLKKELEDAKAKIAELEAALEAAKADQKPSEELEALKAENEKLNATVAEIQAALDKLKEEKATLDAAKAEVDTALADAKQEAEVLRKEKEDAEAAGVTLQEEFKAFVSASVNDLRVASGKVALAEEELQKRSFDSLKDTIRDLREELGKAPEVHIEEAHVPNPTIPPQEDKPGKTKKNEDYMVDLSEGVESLFTNII